MCPAARGGPLDQSKSALWIFPFFHPFAEPNTSFSICVGLIKVFRQQLNKSQTFTQTTWDSLVSEVFFSDSPPPGVCATWSQWTDRLSETCKHSLCQDGWAERCWVEPDHLAAPPSSPQHTLSYTAKTCNVSVLWLAGLWIRRIWEWNHKVWSNTASTRQAWVSCLPSAGSSSSAAPPSWLHPTLHEPDWTLLLTNCTEGITLAQHLHRVCVCVYCCRRSSSHLMWGCDGAAGDLRLKWNVSLRE